jgi:hypothetical protein
VAQKHEAARQAPRQLQAQSPGRSSRAAEHTLRLRVYATPTYSNTVVNWQKQFADMLECANSVVMPEFGAKFEVAEFIPFRPRASEEKLDGLLSELTTQDSATDVHWVVGLAGAVPRFAASADDLGLAPLLGNHFVLRAMSDVHEYEAIQHGLSELSEDERLKLYQARKRHKLCSVFLHEVAHTLGVPHERTEPSLMNTRYQVKAQGFSDEAAEIVRAALQLRANQPALFLDAPFAQKLHSSMSRAGAEWEATSRDQILRSLASFSGTAPAVSGSSAARTGPPSSPREPQTAMQPPKAASTAGLNAEEQRSYDRARAELGAGHVVAAREIAAPLLNQHADLPAVQSLRCDMATAAGGDWETISSECSGLSPFGAPQ